MQLQTFSGEVQEVDRARSHRATAWFIMSPGKIIELVPAPSIALRTSALIYFGYTENRGLLVCLLTHDISPISGKGCSSTKN